MSEQNLPAVLAKTRAMYGKRLTAAQYDEMLRCKSVPEVVALLKQHETYRSALANLTEGQMHRGHIEELLHRAFFEQSDELYYYQGKNAGTLFDYFLLESEIRELLRLILLLHANEAERFIFNIPEHLMQRGRLNFMAMSKVRSFEELIAVLEDSHSVYASVLKPFRTGDDAKLPLLRIEQALWHAFYSRLFADCVGQPQEQIAIISLHVELINLQNLYRNALYLHLPNEELSHFLLPYSYMLSEREQQALLAAENEEDFFRVLRDNHFYARYQLDVNETVEHFVQRIYHKRCLHTLHFTNDSDLAFYCYLSLLEQELHNVITLLEGVRYKMSEKEVRALLILEE